MQLLLPGEDIKFSDPADVGGSYEAFQYRTLLACCSAMGVPYTNVTGDLRQANYSSLREGKQAADQQFARWVMLHVQSNPLPICTRPRVLIKGKRT
jgi:capsid protein